MENNPVVTIDNFGGIMALNQNKRAFKKNEIITKEGDLTFEWYILVSGKIGVYKGENKINELAEAGVIFGELSGLLARPRTATMKAIEDSEVMVVESSIDEVIRSNPDIANKILISLAERLAKTTDELWSVTQKKT